MAFRPRTINDEGGIVVKLDNEAGLHNGFGYKQFDLFCRLNVPNTILARLMAVKTVDTIKNWKAYREQVK